MSPRQSSGALAEQPTVTTARRGLWSATGFEGRRRPIGASRLETFDAWPPGDPGDAEPAEPVVLDVPDLPSTELDGRLVPTNEPSADTCSQSSATLSVASAWTMSSPAPQEMWSTAPFAASIVSLADPVSIVFWPPPPPPVAGSRPAPAPTVVGRLVSPASRVSLPSPRFTTSFPIPSDTQRNFQACTDTQLPL